MSHNNVIPGCMLLPEFRVVVDRRHDGIDPRDQSGFYVRARDTLEACEAYWRAHPEERHLELFTERWKEPMQ